MPRLRKPRTITAPPDLHRRWRVALADAQTNEKAWANERGLSSNHVREVVLGLRTSEHVLRDAITWVQSRERMIVKRITAATAA